MKSVMLGMIGFLITIYTLLIGLNVLTIQSHKNQLDRSLSRIIKNVLETEYPYGEGAMVEQMLREEIIASISSKAPISVEIQAIDLQKGVLSVKVTETISTVVGTPREIVMEKTAIVERAAVYE